MSRGFGVAKHFSVRNRYALKYWARLAPVFQGIKPKLLDFLNSHPLGQMPIELGAGNMGVIAELM